MADESYTPQRCGVVNTAMVLDALLVGHLVWPELRLGFCLFASWRKHGIVPVERTPDHSSVSGCFLEDAPHIRSASDRLPHDQRTVRSDVAHEDTSLAHDRDGVWIDAVLRLGDELDGVAGTAEGDLEAAAGAALVGVVSTDNHE